MSAGGVPWYLVAPALVPLLLPAVAIPQHLLLGGAAGGALWGAIGGGLAGACWVVARRTRWGLAGRLLAGLGLACLGLMVLLGALVGDALLRAARAGAPPDPAVTVAAVYPGANAQVVADTVAAPIEQQVNGVENLLSLRSRCHNDGSYVLTVTFAPGTDLAIAQVLVQNRVNLALPILPDLIRHTGITVRKKPANVLLLLKIFSPDRSRDNGYLARWAQLHLKGPLLTLPGVADVELFGERDEGTRIWLRPERLARLGLTVPDVVHALEAQDVKVAGRPGQKGGAPEAPLRVEGPGRLPDLEQLPDVVVKVANGGRIVRLKEVAEFEAGGGAGAAAALLNGEPVVLLGLSPTPQARPRDVGEAVKEALGRLGARLPAGVGVEAAFDFTPNLEAAGRATTPEYLLLDLTLPPGASGQRILEVLRRCQAAVAALGGVQGTLALTDHPFDRVRDRPCVLVRLAPPGERGASREEITEAIRTRLVEIQEVTLRVRDLSRPGGFARWRYPVQLALEDRGDIGLGQLTEVAARLAEQLRRSGQLTDVAMSPDAEAQPQLDVIVDRRAAADHGVALKDIFIALQAQIGAAHVNDVNRFGRIWRVSLRPGPQAGAEELLRLEVRGAGGQKVPLARLVTARRVPGPTAINRHNLYGMVEITANLAPGVSLEQARAECEAHALQIRQDRRLADGWRLTWLQDRPAPE